MGKSKGQNVELMNAFSRMNFLFQASLVAAKTVPDSVLGNYYGQLMKEVSKKVVEKIHPDIKRSLCCCCSYPLFANGSHATAKVKPHKKKKYKKKSRDVPRNTEKTFKRKKSTEDSIMKNVCVKQLRLKKDLKPNKVSWSCNKCGFTKVFLQRPSHELWIDNYQEDEGRTQKHPKELSNSD